MKVDGETYSKLRAESIGLCSETSEAQKQRLSDESSSDYRRENILLGGEFSLDDVADLERRVCQLVHVMRALGALLKAQESSEVSSALERVWGTANFMAQSLPGGFKASPEYGKLMEEDA